MFSRAATTALSSRRGAAVIFKNTSKLTNPTRAFSEAAAKQPVDIPPVGKHWCKGNRHGHGKRVAGKVLAFGLVGYGGYWYGSKYGAVKLCSPPASNSDRIEPAQVEGHSGDAK